VLSPDVYRKIVSDLAVCAACGYRCPGSYHYCPACGAALLPPAPDGADFERERDPSDRRYDAPARAGPAGGSRAISIALATTLAALAGVAGLLIGALMR